MSERIYEKDGDTLLKPKEEIVRCKDCKNWHERENGTGDCQRCNSYHTNMNDYCSFAERKEQ